jgi:hypothetical protein
VSLKDKIIKSEYRSLIDNVVQDFYIPLLHESTSYKRAVGFFSSSALVEISKGIADMAKDGGKIEIVASPYLSDDDIQAIKEGYENRQKIIEGALIRQLSDEHEDYYSMERLNLLAHLISDGILDIRIAYTDKDNEIGMYHEKMGILEDKDGNHVAFSGSMNESMTAMSINYETIDVFCDWREAEADRVKLKENAFYSMWNNVEPSLKVLEFPNISDVLIEKYRNKDPNFDIDHEQFKRRILAYGSILQGIRTAFILASTTNPKEYIQRRGRVLRKAANKPFAEIYDFVTLPRPLDSVSGLTIEQANRDKTLVKNELARIKEFGRLALNSMLANNLIWDIQEAYHLNETDLEKEGEDFE